MRNTDDEEEWGLRSLIRWQEKWRFTAADSSKCLFSQMSLFSSLQVLLDQNAGVTEFYSRICSDKVNCSGSGTGTSAPCGLGAGTGAGLVLELRWRAGCPPPLLATGRPLSLLRHTLSLHGSSTGECHDNCKHEQRQKQTDGSQSAGTDHGGGPGLQVVHVQA